MSTTAGPITPAGPASRARSCCGPARAAPTPPPTTPPWAAPPGGAGEPVAELLRPGRAGSNTAVDHVTVLDTALAQIPAALRTPDEHGRVAVLVRTDAAGASKEFAAHLHHTGVEFSVGAS